MLWCFNVCVVVVYGCNINFVFSLVYVVIVIHCGTLLKTRCTSQGVNPNTNHTVRHILG